MSTVLDRFEPKVDLTDPKGCWPWQAGLKGGGYGGFMIEDGRNGSTTGAHRAAWELLVGDIPEGLTIDHLCRNVTCVNPDHLEPVSIKVNVLRGRGPSAQNARKNQCPAGHRYDFRDNGGKRRCRQCNARWNR